MRVKKQLVYINLCALAVNALFLFLAAVKACPPLLAVAIIVVCLAGCILFSAKANGKTLKKRVPFHSAPTERVSAIARQNGRVYE